MDGELLLAIGAVFTTVGLLSALAASWLLGRAAPEQRRLRAMAAQAAMMRAIVAQPIAHRSDPALDRLMRVVPRSPRELSRLRRRLMRAGYRDPNAAACFVVAQFALPLAAGALLFTVLGVQFWPVALLGGAVAYVLPPLFVRRRTRQRQKMIQNGLPDALDLMTVCVEAGSGLDQAVAKAGDELVLAHPALAEELRMVTTETRAGKPRSEAFANFGERTGLEEVRTFVSMLNQTDRFGTSIAQALRSHADTSRTRRRQRAEERAGKVGVKLVFPLALCLFPALYVVCFGPIVVQIYHSFFGAGR